MVHVLLFLWHAFEWALVIFGLLLAFLAGLRYSFGLTGVAAGWPLMVPLPPRDSPGREWLADDLIFVGGIALRWARRVLSRVASFVLSVVASVLAGAFFMLAWPLARAIRALDARDWQLRRRRP